MKATILPILTSISLLCIACQSNPLTQQPSTSTTPISQTSASTSAPTSKTSLPPTQTYDLQVNDPQIVARLTQIAFTDDSIVVTMAFTNVSQEAIQLNAKDDFILRDDTSYNTNQYRLMVPSDNPKIQIQPGTTLKGQFVFVGRISPQATNLSIATNSSLPSYSRLKNFPYINFSNLLIQR
ncbi:hypothetical protein ACE1B6_28595 [Aerosakkonemataceae cyanobacterium BLCC-F154]|uniref:DUF4352 domain-containing protein n=1 Tax=Floridaenema fluviatile BLCC-F154 TaxID=3153640 RepID=A0ABV4YK72_9CYAN